MLAWFTDLINTFNYIPVLLCYGLLCLCITALFTAWCCPSSTSVSKTNTTQLVHFNNIDFLRIILILIIIFNHEFEELKWFTEGRNVVEFFFIISGFMLAYTFNSKRKTSDFIKIKLIRFIPYIFLANCLWLCIQDNIDIPKFLSGIFFFQITGAYPYYTTQGTTWYLTVLFWISLFYFSLFKAFKKEVCYCIIGLITFLAWSGMRIVLHVDVLNAQFPLLTNGFVRGLSTIGIGYFTAIAFENSAKEQTTPTLSYSLIELALLCYLPVTLFISKYHTPIIIQVIFFTILLWLFLNQRGHISCWLNKINWQPISKFVLPLFVTHEGICRMQGFLHIWEDDTAIVRISLTVICSIILAIGSYYAIQSGYSLSQRLHKHH